MFRMGRRHSLVRQVLTLLAIPLVLMSTGYALFSQKLSVSGRSGNVSYSATQQVTATYEKSTAPAGNGWQYTMSPVTIHNNRTLATESWQLVFDLPAGASHLSCTNATCTQSGSTVTATNLVTNGTIAPGASTNFSFTFRAAGAQYTLQNIVVSATFARTYETINGLNVTFTTGARVKSGKWNYWPHVFTVTNTSGQNISSWRITATWSSGSNVIRNVSTTVNYVAGASELSFTSKNSLGSGSTFQFNAELGATANSWTLTGVTIQGSR